MIFLISVILNFLLGLSFFDTYDLIDIDSYLDNHKMDEFRLEETNQINNIIKNNVSIMEIIYIGFSFGLIYLLSNLCYNFILFYL